MLICRWVRLGRQYLAFLQRFANRESKTHTLLVSHLLQGYCLLLTKPRIPNHPGLSGESRGNRVIGYQVAGSPAIRYLLFVNAQLASGPDYGLPDYGLPIKEFYSFLNESTGLARDALTVRKPMAMVATISVIENARINIHGLRLTLYAKLFNQSDMKYQVVGVEITKPSSTRNINSR